MIYMEVYLYYYTIDLEGKYQNKIKKMSFFIINFYLKFSVFECKTISRKMGTSQYFFLLRYTFIKCISYKNK